MGQCDLAHIDSPQSHQPTAAHSNSVELTFTTLAVSFCSQLPYQLVAACINPWLASLGVSYSSLPRRLTENNQHPMALSVLMNDSQYQVFVLNKKAKPASWSLCGGLSLLVLFVFFMFIVVLVFLLLEEAEHALVFLFFVIAVVLAVEGWGWLWRRPCAAWWWLGSVLGN